MSSRRLQPFSPRGNLKMTLSVISFGEAQVADHRSRISGGTYRWATVVGALILVCSLSTMGLGGVASASGSSKSVVKLGLVMSLTGVAASSYANGQYGAIARMAADLMIKGLQLAGKNPTHASFISGLRKDCAYTAGGILASPTSMCHFGTLAMLPKQLCTYVVQLQGTHYVLANGGKEICSTRQAQT